MIAKIASALCVVGGFVLLGHAAMTNDWDALPVAMGLYFIGKGIFIHESLRYLKRIADK